MVWLCGSLLYKLSCTAKIMFLLYGNRIKMTFIALDMILYLELYCPVTVSDCFVLLQDAFYVTFISITIFPKNFQINHKQVVQIGPLMK